MGTYANQVSNSKSLLDRTVVVSACGYCGYCSMCDLFMVSEKCMFSTFKVIDVRFLRIACKRCTFKI